MTTPHETEDEDLVVWAQDCAWDVLESAIWNALAAGIIPDAIEDLVLDILRLPDGERPH
jgi:hypothetical protein